MSTFLLSPEQLRALADGWRRHGREVAGLRFETGFSELPGCSSASGLARCARAAQAAAAGYAGDLTGLGDAVHRFSTLTETSDVQAGVGIAAAADPGAPR